MFMGYDSHIKRTLIYIIYSVGEFPDGRPAASGTMPSTSTSANSATTALTLSTALSAAAGMVTTFFFFFTTTWLSGERG